LYSYTLKRFVTDIKIPIVLNYLLGDICDWSCHLDQLFSPLQRYQQPFCR